MLARRPLLILAPACGLLAGALTWLGVAALGLPSRALAQTEAQVAALRAPRLRADAVDDHAAQKAMENPLFALTAGPHAVVEPVLKLEGLARFAGDEAALVSIGDKPAEWLHPGERREGVSLVEVRSGRVVLDTATGFKTLGVGETSAPAPLGQTPAASPPVAAPARDTPPPGFRLPPPPASAPGGQP